MKKVFLFIALVCAAYISNAQDFKPAAGAKNLELQMAPLGGTPISISGIRYRQFLSATSAFRVNLFVGYNRETKIERQADAITSTTVSVPELRSWKSGLTVNLRPGYEIHFAGTERLSPYVGGELDFAIATSKNLVEKDTMTTATTFGKYEETTKGKDGYLRVGLNAVLGCDFYVVKHLYIGAEMGFGFSINSKSDLTFESTKAGWKATAADKTVQGSTFDLGPNVVGQFRIGYIF